MTTPSPNMKTSERIMQVLDKYLDEYTRKCDGCDQPHPLSDDAKARMHDKMQRVLMVLDDGTEDTEEEIQRMVEHMKLSLDIAFSEARKTHSV